MYELSTRWMLDCRNIPKFQQKCLVIALLKSRQKTHPFSLPFLSHNLKSSFTQQSLYLIEILSFILPKMLFIWPIGANKGDHCSAIYLSMATNRSETSLELLSVKISQFSPKHKLSCQAQFVKQPVCNTERIAYTSGNYHRP